MSEMENVELMLSDTLAFQAPIAELNHSGSFSQYIQIVRCAHSTRPGECTTNRINVRTMKMYSESWAPLEGISSYQQGLDLNVFDMFSPNEFDKETNFFVIYNRTHIMSCDRGGSLNNVISYNDNIYLANTLPTVHMHPQSSTFVIVSRCLLHYGFNRRDGKFTFLKEICSSFDNKMYSTIGSITPSNDAILFTFSPVNSYCLIIVYDLYSMELHENSTLCSNRLSQVNVHLLSNNYNSMVSMGNDSYFAIHSTGIMVELSADPEYNNFAMNRSVPTRETVLHSILDPFSEFMRDIVYTTLVYDANNNGKTTLVIQSGLNRLWFLDIKVSSHKSEIEKLDFGKELTIQPILTTNGSQVPETAHVPFSFKENPRSIHVMFHASTSERIENNATVVYTYNPDHESVWSKSFLFTDIRGQNSSSLDLLYFIFDTRKQVYAISKRLDSRSAIWSTTVDKNASVESRRIVIEKNSTEGLTLTSYLCFSDAESVVFSASSNSSDTTFLVQINVVTGFIKGIIDSTLSIHRQLTAIPRNNKLYVVAYRTGTPTFYRKTLWDTHIKVLVIPFSFSSCNYFMLESKKRVNFFITGAFGDSHFCFCRILRKESHLPYRYKKKGIPS